MFYIASPYSGTPEQMRKRFKKTTEYTIALAEFNIPVISPIVHWHTPAQLFKLPRDFNFWKVQNDALLDVCTGMIVFMLPGWKESKGLRYEMQVAQDKNMPVFFIDLESEDWQIKRRFAQVAKAIQHYTESTKEGPTE